MVSGWRYRVVSITGTALLTAGAITLANLPALQSFVGTGVPVLNRLKPTVLTNGQLSIALTTSLLIIVVLLVPLFKPRPRRILDTVSLAVNRVFVAALALAAIGYFDYTYRLPRTTLVLITVLLLVSLPPWFVWIRNRPSAQARRAIIIGDEPSVFRSIVSVADQTVLGYVGPPSVAESQDTADPVDISIADGGAVPSLEELEHLGGFSRLEDVFVEYDVDTALLAFGYPDRAEFFGALDACYEHGIAAKIHREQADSVLTDQTGAGDLVDVDLEPWDWQEYVFKRLFDVAFAGVGLLVLAPAIVAIAIAIKLDSPGPILYGQERTAEFGETFEIYKFRSMIQDAESETGARLSDDDRGSVDERVTRVGGMLRRTHLDEIPQLWSILVGDMSVVGPRPERPELDTNIERGVVDWRRRWFVKPGLTGLAQINDVTGYEPVKKLRYDVEYIRRQSFWLDLKIVIRQLWQVLDDLVSSLRKTVRHR